MTILGFCGTMGSGKDTACDYLVQKYDFHKLSIAKAIKDEVYACLYDATVPRDAPRELRILLHEEIGSNVRSGLEPDPFSKPTPARMRQILQLWGKEYRRDQDPDYWVKQLPYQINLLQRKLEAKDEKGIFKSEELNICIPDCRYPNELEWIDKQGGKSIYIIRIRDYDTLRTATTEHISEKAITFRDTDYMVRNEGTIEELHEKLDTLMKEFLNVSQSAST